jgi:hypothetical protein
MFFLQNQFPFCALLLKKSLLIPLVKIESCAFFNPENPVQKNRHPCFRLAEQKKVAAG